MLDPRAVALQGVGYTPAALAAQGFVEAAAVVARAASGVSRLRAITDAKGQVRGGVAWSRTNPAVVRAYSDFVLIDLPAAEYALGSRHHARSGAPRARASAKLVVSGARSHSRVGASGSEAAACTAILGAAHASYEHSLDARCAATGTVVGGVAIAGGHDATGRGQHRRTAAQLAAILAVVDRA